MFANPEHCPYTLLTIQSYKEGQLTDMNWNTLCNPDLLEKTIVKNVEKAIVSRNVTCMSVTRVTILRFTMTISS